MTHTYVLTDVQEAALAEHVADVNVGRVAQGKAAFPTIDDFMAAQIATVVAPIAGAFTAAQFDALKPLFASADLSSRAKVKTELEKK